MADGRSTARCCPGSRRRRRADAAAGRRGGPAHRRGGRARDDRAASSASATRLEALARALLAQARRSTRPRPTRSPACRCRVGGRGARAGVGVHVAQQRMEVLVAAQPGGEVEHDADDHGQHAGKDERGVDADALRAPGRSARKEIGGQPDRRRTSPASARAPRNAGGTRDDINVRPVRHAARPRQPDERERHGIVVDVVDLPRLGHRGRCRRPAARRSFRSTAARSPARAGAAAASRVLSWQPPCSSPSTVPRGPASRPSPAPSRGALGFTYLDSGALYRAVALAGAARPARSLRHRASSGDRVLLDGEDVTRGDPHARGLAARPRGAPPTRRCARRCVDTSARSSPAATGSPRGATSAPSSRPTPTLKVWLTADAAPSARAAPRAQPVERGRASATSATRAREHSADGRAPDAVEVDTTGPDDRRGRGAHRRPGRSRVTP